VPRTLAMKKSRTFFTELKNWRKLKTGLHGFLQNCARLKKVCKKTSETSARQSSLGGVQCLAPLSTSNQWYPQSSEIAFKSRYEMLKCSNVMHGVWE
jgi:hypothetical protein